VLHLSITLYIDAGGTAAQKCNPGDPYLNAGKTALPTQLQHRRFPHCELLFYHFPSSLVYCKVQHDPLFVLLL
jgi:hypothetical protein